MKGAARRSYERNETLQRQATSFLLSIVVTCRLTQVNHQFLVAKMPRYRPAQSELCRRLHADQTRPIHFSSANSFRKGAVGINR